MKKYLCLILIFCLILTGCTGKNTENPHTDPTTPHTESTQEPIVSEDSTEPPYNYPQLPMVAVSLPIHTESTTSDSGTMVSSYTYQSLQLAVQDQQVADRIILDYLNRQDHHHSIASSVSQQAENTYREGSSWTPYFYTTTYTSTRLDHAVLSLFGKNVQYTGGNHPYTECTAANYNMLTGDVLTLGSILTNISAKEKLCAALNASATAISKDKQLYEDYPHIIEDRLARDESYDEDWFFSSTGLCFFFSPYEIAPYISGSVVIEVPYDQLGGILHSSFFPAEEDLSEGKIIAQNATDTVYDNFTQIAEITVDAEGESIFLYSEGLVRDVQIYVDSGASIFRTYTLSPGDGILLTADFLQEDTDLQITYRTGSEIKNQTIEFNTKDHSFLLADNSAGNP